MTYCEKVMTYCEKFMSRTIDIMVMEELVQFPPPNFPTDSYK